MILAGGLGTRISEESELKPKPMVEIGGMPIIWHVMKIYESAGITDFIICCGYKGYMIKEFFMNYLNHKSDMTINLRSGGVDYHGNSAEDWNVTLVDTGERTQTGGRLKRVIDHINEQDFCMTYGDGLADVDVRKLIDFHRRTALAATVTGVAPPGRFGALVERDGLVADFQEKPKGDGALINGGFFVLNRSVVERVGSDSTVWEAEPLHSLVEDKQLAVFKHEGFWQPMDTLREKVLLNELWASGDAPWKIWQ